MMNLCRKAFERYAEKNRGPRQKSLSYERGPSHDCPFASHLDGDDQEFLSVAMQAAAHEARLGHVTLAKQLRDLIDEAKRRASAVQSRPGQLIVLEPRGELANLLSVQSPTARLGDMAMPDTLSGRLNRVLLEQRQQKKLREHGLKPRKKLLFIGPPGTGKTMTASALAGELHLPLFTIMLEGLITKFMGETAAKLRLVFEAIRQTQGVYLFDKFDALGSHRNQTNDVGEIRRVLNSFLQLLEKDTSQSLVVAATNHPDLLDRALFRRFDDVIEYQLPDKKGAKEILQRKLAMFQASDVEWSRILPVAAGLSHADLARACEEAAKRAVLSGSTRITTEGLLVAIQERKAASRFVGKSAARAPGRNGGSGNRIRRGEGIQSDRRACDPPFGRGECGLADTPVRTPLGDSGGRNRRAASGIPRLADSTRSMY